MCIYTYLYPYIYIYIILSYIEIVFVNQIDGYDGICEWGTFPQKHWPIDAWNAVHGLSEIFTIHHNLKLAIY